ncbi:hypothetical protein [uncultured Dubosiella sp.]|uniref:hypothetical protein n=1 Tax=uncultured Dubosiella sp. TaxID=1937011 RepID=UPI00208BDB4D|nr:hypothetical protein [uncultured Dubosiella sp.]GJM56731.1 hypothetical protein EROP_04240 [Erysipelotrichaceae bacterium OPF54]
MNRRKNVFVCCFLFLLGTGVIFFPQDDKCIKQENVCLPIEDSGIDVQSGNKGEK